MKNGDRVSLSGQLDDWDGDTWLQAKTTNERQGWLPLAYFKQTNKQTTGWQTSDFSMNTLALT